LVKFVLRYSPAGAGVERTAALRQYAEFDFFPKNKHQPPCGALRQYAEFDFFPKNKGLPNAPYPTLSDNAQKNALSLTLTLVFSIICYCMAVTTSSCDERKHQHQQRLRYPG
jgi:hypothetical protein